METRFSLQQLADPDTRESEKILRACVHCGFCTATCPTYVLLGDELDSPRGRIYLMKQMLESGAPITENVVTHIDRCLSCLSCMTTCPSGVHYMHLVDHGRHYIEHHYRRPPLDRLMRGLIARVLPYPNTLRILLTLALPFRWLGKVLPGRIGELLTLAPATVPPASPIRPGQVFPAAGTRRKRVALLTGCVQSVVAPEINEATIRLLTRHGCDVVVAEGMECCGALEHHLGRDARDRVRRNVDAWTKAGVDAIVVNTSGCGTTIKDYGFMLREDAAYADKAARVSAMTRDISELMSEIGLNAPVPHSLRVAYQNPCSMQHGQKIVGQPKALLTAAGFTVLPIAEEHLCCGSAGSYNILQPELANDLRARKVANLEATSPDVIATGNVGCEVHIAGATAVPVVHTVELLDWATGGPKPPHLK
ncbi:MAG TPA: glycolate oxidase subunit GlcF [Alphaproteobacteria bacterium]|jgi:glycolate oxidase iron-sulfur subunit|nr:glycolate oxidase subunit GlcF [Alphaproteobacteria bacterium]